MKIPADQRRVAGELDRLKPRFGILPTLVQTSRKCAARRKRHQKHRARDVERW